MFVALYECLFVLRGSLLYPGGGGGYQTGPRVRGGGARGGNRWTGPQDRGGGARGGRRGGPGGRRGRLGVTLAGCQATRGGSRSSRRRSGALRAAPRVSPKTRSSFKIDGFIKDEHRLLKNSKSHPELHRASPKASQELPRVPQVTSTALPRVPQGTPKSPWEGGGPPGHPWEDMGGDPWGPWRSLGVIGGPLGALGGYGGLRGSPRGAFEICVFRASETRAQSSPETP